MLRALNQTEMPLRAFSPAKISAVTDKMSRLDVVIFGATGFTGKRTVIHMVNFAKKYQIGSWGIAGRSENKLNDVIKEASQKTAADLSAVKIITADVGDEKSLKDMCVQAKVLVNCCGPYRMYGEPVVKAAIDSKTHYVDVSGEPQFMELMQLRYDEAAREAGVFVISACGWDSIPNDMGVVFLQQNFAGTLNSVRSYLRTYVPPEVMAKAEGRGLVNYGTWESLVYSVHHSNELRPLRKQLYPEALPHFKPKLTRALVHKKDGEDYYLPFLGADESVIYRSQRYMYQWEQKRPVQFKAYFNSGNFFQTGLAIIAAMVFFVMAKITFTKNLLLKYPKFFSMGYVTKDGPTDIVMENSFFSFDLIGEGWDVGTEAEGKPNKKVVAKVRGTNPGYGATCVALLSAAVTLLTEREKMPLPGGILTTAAAFKNTDIIKKLNENDLTYKITETTKI
ncbi:unnamed protein product [Arctia plantaginis]|uniref:Saccharopine dehydrogenase NADP binding domain-containing protein n=1 Tax=Arctia plantaginis TaxID=874455 RepID=A0A8S0ZYB8_ARCPL|nr:unnamed protein product [Arctia plantaginis]CAB3237478.1 unnamed protein product [Arctia plantaginis]